MQKRFLTFAEVACATAQQIHIFDFGDGLSDETHIGGFIALAAMGNRRKIGRIGFHEDFLQRHFAHHFAQRLGIFESNDAGE